MKDIKSIFEGMFSSDVSGMKGYEPIEIPDLEAKFRAWALIKYHIHATNNAVKEQMMLTRIDKLKSILDEFERQEIEDAKSIAHSARDLKKVDMWYYIMEIKSYLSKGFKIEDQEAIANYNLWSGFAKAIKELFKDPLVKKYILSGDGIFYFEDGEVYWHQNKKTTWDVDAVIKKVQKILPSNLISISQEPEGGENGVGTEIHFDSGVLSNY